MWSIARSGRLAYFKRTLSSKMALALNKLKHPGLQSTHALTCSVDFCSQWLTAYSNFWYHAIGPTNHRSKETMTLCQLDKSKLYRFPTPSQEVKYMGNGHVNIIQLQHDNKKFCSRHGFWLCIYCDLDLGYMTLNNNFNKYYPDPVWQ